MPSTATPAQHDDHQIRLVAAGLMVLTTTEEAATQLRRVYGEQRAGQALAPLAPRRPCDRPGSIASARRPVAALAPGRRGTRPTDWI